LAKAWPASLPPGVAVHIGVGPRTSESESRTDSVTSRETTLFEPLPPATSATVFMLPPITTSASVGEPSG
jgi:hypothetical protein